MRCEENDRSGFTLLELIVVLFLITLVTGLASFFFIGNTSSSRFNATVRELSATIRRAKLVAEAKCAAGSIMIDFDGRRYGIEGYGYRNIPPDIGIKVIDPVTGETGSGTYRLLFQPTGGIKPATIILWNRRKKATIEIDPVVGFVIVK